MIQFHGIYCVSSQKLIPKGLICPLQLLVNAHAEHRTICLSQSAAHNHYNGEVLTLLEQLNNLTSTLSFFQSFLGASTLLSLIFLSTDNSARHI